MVLFHSRKVVLYWTRGGAIGWVREPTHWTIHIGNFMLDWYVPKHKLDKHFSMWWDDAQSLKRPRLLVIWRSK